MTLQPIKISQNPDGAMLKTAMKQSQFSKDRKDIREMQNLSKKTEEQPTMLKATMRENLSRPKDSVQFSRKEQLSLSIQGQKESLPIYKLRDQLVEAIKQNQVLVVIGETGSGKTT